MNWKLKATIHERYGTQWRFAQHLGIDPATVSRVVRGAADISGDEKNRWAKELKTTVRVFDRGTAAI